MSVVIGAKILGGAMVIGGSAGIGIVKNRVLQEKIKQIHELERIMIMVENEISYRQSTVPEILNNMVYMTENKELQKVFMDTQENLQATNNLTQSVKSALNQSNISKDVKHIISELLSNIGNCNIDGAIGNIQFCKTNAEQLEQKALRHQEQYGKVYKGLPLLGGIGLTLILL